MLIGKKTFESLLDTFLARLQKEHGLALAREGVMVDASFCPGSATAGRTTP